MRQKIRQVEESDSSITIKKSEDFNIDRILTSFMENFAYYMIIITSVYFLISLPQIFKFHKEFEVHDNLFDFNELLYIFAGFSFCLITYYTLPYLLDNYIRSNLTDQNNRKESLEERISRLVNNIHSLLYYMVSLSVGILVTSGTNLRPKMLNGTMDLDYAVSSWPQTPNNYVRYYFLFTLGHHIERQYNLWVHKRKNGDFWTLNLHHILTIFLMVYSYSMRLLYFGVPVVIIHDISDIFYNIAKLTRCLRTWRPFMYVFMAIFTFSWLYTRIICYTKEVLLPLKRQAFLQSYIQQNYYLIGIFEVFCLYVLGILNYYWFALIVKIGFNLTKKNDKIINEEK